MPEQTEQEKQAQYTVILGETIRTLVEELNPLYWDQVQTFVRAIKLSRGSISPSEEFIRSIVFTYGYRGRLEADDITMALEEFRDNLKDAINAARLMLQQYPDDLKPEGDSLKA